ncbi:MAG: GNAT superfamily N-acetyltransferase [Paracoccaceae bacterium]|jgi:GNAT superfamily N-acetyltransferase
MSELVIRPIRPTDEPDWRRLWAGYLDYYETSVTEEVYVSSFARLLAVDDQEFHGLVAELDGKAVGLTHYLFHRHMWKVENTCYLQDLYADPEIRGKGIGRALIQAVYAAADAAGISAVYWLTQEFNYKGRILYDRVGTKTPFIRYDRG